MLMSKELVLGIPLFAWPERRAALDVGDMKPAPEKFDFGLRLVIPITALPRPWIPSRRCPRHDNHATPLAFPCATDAVFFVLGGFGRGDREARLIHDKIVSSKTVPGSFLAGECQTRLGTVHCFNEPEGAKYESQSLIAHGLI